MQRGAGSGGKLGGVSQVSSFGKVLEAAAQPRERTGLCPENGELHS